MIHRDTFALGLVFALVIGLWACSTPQSVVGSAGDEPPIRAASNFLHPPFSSRSEVGEPIGIEVELVNEAARLLRREVEWVELPFGELIAAVAGGDVDLAVATLGVTAERARLVAFTEPYFETTIVALARTGANEPRTLDELAGRDVATERGTTTVAALAARVPAAERVLDRPAGTTWADALAAGEIDAIVLDHSHAETFMTDAGVLFHVIEEPLRLEHFAVAVRPEAKVLREALNQIIAEQRALNPR